MTSAPDEPFEAGNLHDRLVDAAVRVLVADGPGNLTVRRVADAAGTSTMGIYTRFGGRTGMLESVYRRGFALLREALEPAGGRVLDLALAYRRFALANPALYAFMFERPVPDFDPDPGVRAEALGATFGLLRDAVADAVAAGTLRAGEPVHLAYLIWSTAHGLVSLELTHAVRSPLPGWYLDSPETGERVYRDGVAAALRGLSP